MRHPVFLLLLVALSGCAGVHDLGDRNCLPLQVPADVILVQEVGLYTRGETATKLLMEHPRDAANDASARIRLETTLEPGTSIRIQRLVQEWGYDIGQASIKAMGLTPDGDKFEYHWGFGDKIYRAPWEPETSDVRVVACKT
ncbi:hypothetical protein E2F46_08835 [Luteimonas aestuarii]|uniref:Lipoprotein n=1 Tax=Luteimonas aestuarii TaxID=453837 RepID=A0A4V3ALU2_9GAMM|nr:hypothetical protein [Luteimonas aestuarii]TDK24377.1 hypothetical protein E2F46_08835 [Luteimonas aestuarii]